MSEFNSKPSAAFIRAVELLRMLPLVERVEAYAEATADDRRKDAMKQLGSVRSKNWEKLAGIKAHHTKVLPADDHGELRAGKSLTYTSQPYHISLEQMRGIISLCDEHGLNVLVDAQSWYFPGMTLRMTYTKPPKSN